MDGERGWASASEPDEFTSLLFQLGSAGLARSGIYESVESVRAFHKSRPGAGGDVCSGAGNAVAMVTSAPQQLCATSVDHQRCYSLPFFFSLYFAAMLHLPWQSSHRPGVGFRVLTQCPASERPVGWLLTHPRLPRRKEGDRSRWWERTSGRCF